VDSEATLEQLQDLAFELLEAPWPSAARPSRGEALVRVADALARRAPASEWGAYLDSRSLATLCAEGRNHQAQEFSVRAVARAPRRSVQTGALLTEVADMLRIDGRYREALERLETAREHFAELEKAPETADANARVLLGVHHGVAADAWLGLGLPDVADAHIRAEGELALALGDRYLRQSFHDHRMKRCQALEDYAALERAIVAAQTDPLLAPPTPRFAAKLGVRNLLAQVELERRGRPRGAAQAAYETLLDAPELDEYDRQEAHVHGAFLAFDRRDDAACVAAVARVRASPLHDLAAPVGYTPEYEACLRGMEFEIAARRAPLAPTELAQRREALASSYSAFVAWWRESPERRGGVGFLAFGRRRYLVDAVIHAELSRGAPGAEAALAALELAQSSGSLTRALGAAQVEPLRARDVLCADGAAVLSYLPGRARSHVLVLDSRGVQHFELPAGERIEAARAEVEARLAVAVRELGDWGDPHLGSVLPALRDALLPPALLAQLENADAVVVVGLDSLGYTPFELLADARGEPLGWRRAVSYAPSLSAAVALAERARTRTASPASALILAPRMDSACATPWGLAPFETPKSALRSMAEAWNGRARWLADETATRLELERSEAGVLHLITHGYFDPRRELAAAVLLAREDSSGCEPWWSEDASRASEASIVLLTACGAWRGPRRRGDDGHASFAGQWIEGGADAVVLAQTELELERALALAQALHAELARGEPVAMALTRARRTLANAPEELPLQHLVTHVFGHGAARAAPELDRRDVRAPRPSASADSEAPARWKARAGWLAAGLVGAAALALVLRRRRARRSAAQRQ
jgi:CHAT domain-containing protein